MGTSGFTYLDELATPGGYGPFLVGLTLPHEIRSPHMMGLIKLKGDSKTLEDFLEHFRNKLVENLSDHVEVTDAGKRWLELRDSVRRSSHRRSDIASK
jgi:hypothetical protein